MVSDFETLCLRIRFEIPKYCWPKVVDQFGMKNDGLSIFV